MAAAEQSFQDEDFEIEESGYTDEQVGFPPYWKPEAGRKFKATVVARDERDENFPRFVLRASHNVVCQKGPADNDEKVLVTPGQFFTTSVYAALPLDRFVGYEVIVIATKLREGVTRDGNDVWDFRVLTDDATKELMAQNRAALDHPL